MGLNSQKSDINMNLNSNIIKSDQNLLLAAPINGEENL